MRGSRVYRESWPGEICPDLIIMIDMVQKWYEGEIHTPLQRMEIHVDEEMEIHILKNNNNDWYGQFQCRRHTCCGHTGWVRRLAIQVQVQKFLSQKYKIASSKCQKKKLKKSEMPCLKYVRKNCAGLQNTNCNIWHRGVSWCQEVSIWRSGSGTLLMAPRCSTMSTN